MKRGVSNSVVQCSGILWLPPLCLCLLLLFFSSCTQDAYDKGEGPYSQMVAEMADGYTAADKRVTHFVTDDEEHYTVAEPFTSRLMEKGDTVYRAVFYFNKRETGEADVVGLDRVGVIQPRKIDEMKTDPVKMESVWLAKSGRYLNLSLWLMTGAVDSQETIHMLGCRQDTLMEHSDGKRSLYLTLYHDQGDVPEYYSARAYFSIPLSEQNADTITLRINTYDGEKKRKFCLR